MILILPIDVMDTQRDIRSKNYFKLLIPVIEWEYGAEENIWA
jgi:hypothetical protein